MVINAPISSGYSAQVMREAQRRFPQVPIKAVITSTAFFWHIAGIREYKIFLSMCWMRMRAR